MIKVIRIGTRGSPLALWQARWVEQRLRQHHPDRSFELVIIRTTGDKILDTPLSKIGDKGLFTKELDRALLNNRIDLAVHSLKDVPTRIPDGLCIAAVTERAEVRDALISRDGRLLDDLPRGATLATGSLRRKAQLLAYRPDFQIVDLRGNLNTRMRKFQQSSWQGMILAAAGLHRMGWSAEITQLLPLEIMLPAVGQGSFAVICRQSDAETRELLAPLDHRPSRLGTAAERALLFTLEGGCQIPIGAYGRLDGNRLVLDACISSLDGQTLIRDQLVGDPDAPEALGQKLAQRLLNQGGKQILEQIVREGRT
ncbi:MAG: hydroxymethylbilane synthase [Calditrichaeota bacterium]|nr:hydroxymethylbilane synthase [Calditrichota bacterium]